MASNRHSRAGGDPVSALNTDNLITDNLITDNINVWTSAIQKRNSQGRGSNSKVELVGIKKLRELILELAVRGKLVPQDPNDEPASVLLEKIAAEKAQLVADKKIKKQKPLPEIIDEEKPFELPRGWEWSRFGSLAQHNSGKTLDKGRNSGTARSYLTTSNLYWGRFNLDNVKEMLIEDEQLEKCTATVGDLLICEGGEAGRAAVWNGPGDICFQNHIHRARFYENINASYMFRFFEYLTATGLINNYRKGVGISNMSGKSLASIPTVLPPLAEQHRIVAKVDELMALCDQLEQQTEQSLTAHQTLVEELLKSLIEDASGKTTMDGGNVENAGAIFDRIADHFDVLFTTEDSIEQLKQTILQLAVMGKLVPQSPSDEPASKLLEKIAEEKAQLIKDKKIKKQKPLPEITDEEKPFELQSGWEWCRGELIAEFIDPQPSHRTPPKVNGGIPYIGYTDIDHVNGINFDGARKVGEDVFKEHLERYTLKKGDFVFGKIGTLGKPYFLEEPFKYCLSANLILIQPNLNAVVPKYLALYLNSPALYKVMGEQKTNSTHGVFGIKKARLLLIPYPPLSEQHRIVAKVDELMALCDQLKARLADAQTTQLHLADAVVENALSQ